MHLCFTNTSCYIIYKFSYRKIFEAASGNHVAVLKQALDGKYGYVKHEDLELALLSASKNGHSKCVGLLLESKVNIQARDGTDNTPLILASEGGHVEVVDILLQHGSCVDCHNSLGYNALMKACEKGHVKVAEMLIERGAHDETKVENRTIQPKILNTVVTRQLTPLMLAIIKQPPGYEDLIKLLLRRKSAVFDKNAEQCTALHFAAKASNVSVLEILLKAGADVDAKDFWGTTPLMNAASYKQAENVRLLLKHGANVNTTDSMFRSPLSIAARNDGSQVIEMFISSGAVVDHLDAHKNPPLFIAISHKNYAAAKCLIKHGCDLTVCGRHMSTRKVMTFLQLAVWCKDTQMIEILYQAGGFTNKDLHDTFNDFTYSTHCEDTPSVYEYLAWLVKKPRPLASFCRQAILKSCRKALRDSVEQLHVPSAIKEYLRFSDI